MIYQNLAKYSVTQTSTMEFTLDSLNSGYVALNAGIQTVVEIKDAAGQLAVVVGSRTGSVFTVSQLLSTGLTTIPSFGSGTELYSNVDAQLMNNLSWGKGAIVCIGQSNHLGWDGANADITRIDYPVAGVSQNKFEHENLAGDPVDTSEDGPQAAIQPLWWAKESSHGAGSLGSPVIHAANRLVEYEGHRFVEIQPCAKDGAGYQSTEWVTDTGTLYIRTVDMLTEFLNRDPANYIICFLDIGGENDTAGGTTGPNYETYLDTMYTSLKEDIGLATGRDLTTVPIILSGMNDVMSSYGAAFTTIQGVRADTPNRLDYTSYINMAGQPAIDAYHHAIAASRYLGGPGFANAIKAARGNIPSIPNNLLNASSNFTLNTTATLVETNELAVSISIPFTTSADLTVSNDTSLAAAISWDFTSTTANLTIPSETPLTDALAPSIQLRGTKGFTLNGSDVQEWANYGSGVDAIQNTEADQPLESSGSVVFDKANSEFLELASEVFSNASGFSVVMEIAITSGNDGTALNDGQSRLYPTTAMQFVTLGDTGVSYAEDKRDGTLRTYRWVTDGSTVDIWEDGVQKITNQSITQSGSPTGLVLGAFSNAGSFPASFTVRNFVAKPAVQWTTQNMTDIESEWL